MKEKIFEMFGSNGSLHKENIFINIAIAAVIGLVVYLSYHLSHTGTVYSKKFNVSLLSMAVLTATVVTVISDNIALSLGMVGALSIVRFRTAIKDSRDTIYIFWAIIVGICCGVGDYIIAAAGTAIVFVLLLILGRIKNDNRMLVIIRASRSKERDIQAILFSYFNRKAQLRVENTTEETVEFIYEVSKKMMDQANKRQEKELTELLYDLGGVEYVNIVTQNDEVSS